MLDHTTLADAFELAGYIVGIFSLMRMCSRDRSIVTMRRNVMYSSGLANQPFYKYCWQRLNLLIVGQAVRACPFSFRRSVR